MEREVMSQGVRVTFRNQEGGKKKKLERARKQFHPWNLQEEHVLANRGVLAQQGLGGLGFWPTKPEDDIFVLF